MNKTKGFLEEFREETKKLLTDLPELKFVKRVPRNLQHEPKDKEQPKQADIKKEFTGHGTKEALDYFIQKRTEHTECMNEMVNRLLGPEIGKSMCSAILDDYMASHYSDKNCDEYTVDTVMRYIHESCKRTESIEEAVSKTEISVVTSKTVKFHKLARFAIPNHLILGGKEIKNKKLIRQIYLSYLDQIPSTDVETIDSIRKAIRTNGECVIFIPDGSSIMASWKK